jgi:cytochrome c-type biogenesis protein CcmH
VSTGRRLRAGAAMLTLLIALVGPGLTAAGASAAVQQRASFIQVENALMCVVCHEPLAVADSPEAFQERDYVRGLVLQGETTKQILRNVVEQYGPAVLAKPPASGFNLSVYIIPPVVLVVGIAILAFTLPRWRRRTRASQQNGPEATAPALADDDAQRLNEDLARTM